MKKFIIGMLMIAGLGWSQQHTGQWVWPQPVDTKSTENQAKYSNINLWLSTHKLPGSYQMVFFQMPPVSAPGGENPPNWPYISYCKDYKSPQPTLQFDKDSFKAFDELQNTCLVVDYASALNDPPVLLTELENKYQFGDPRVLVQYPDPTPPSPIVVPQNPIMAKSPVGDEITAGCNCFYALDPSVKSYSDGRGTFQLFEKFTPFGRQAWFNKVQ